MSNVYAILHWNTGLPIMDGMSNEAEARRLAQELANERGDAVELLVFDPLDDDVMPDGEMIEPADVITECTAAITARGVDSTVPDRADAVDAEVTVGDDQYDVTLLGAGGALDTWGDLEQWAGADLAERLDAMDCDARRDSVDAIVQAVRNAAAK